MKEVQASKGLLSELPPPPEGKTGWPWDRETDPACYEGINDLPKISIVTPSLNQGKFIEKTIRSVLLQNYPNLEYIVMDGSSTDESAGIIEKYSGWLTHWESVADKGQTNAINKGLSRCTGDIFNWLNSDDYYEPGCFRTIASNFEQGTTGMLAGDYRFFYHDGSEDDKLIDFKLQPTLKETLAIVLINQPSSFFSLEFLRQLGKLDENLQYVMDQDIWKRFLFRYGQESVKYVNELLAHFRVHSESKTYQHKFQKEYNMIFASIARKCNLIDQAEFIEKLFEIGGFNGYSFQHEFDNDTSSVAKGAISVHLYQIARGAYTNGDFRLLEMCLPLIDTDHLTKKQKSYSNKLKIKKTLRKLNILPAFKFLSKLLQG